MNRRKTLYYKIIRLLPFVILAMPLINVSAQSGRKVQESQPTSQSTAPKRTDAKSEFVVDPNADKYKLIFLTSYVGKRTYKYKERKEANIALQKNRNGSLRSLTKQAYKATNLYLS